MILYSLIKYDNAPALEATWVDEESVIVRCHAYSNDPEQIAELRADLEPADAERYAQLIAEVAATYVPPAPPTPEQVAAIVAQKIDALWAAADRYVASYISGVAVGILTIGVMQQKPKCMTVSEWSYMIWAEYYQRKALVTVDSVDNHDFSMYGPIPYTVPELQAEVGI